MKLNINSYAIVIGIDHYTHFPQLQNANRDASDFARWLASPDGGRLSHDNIQLLLSKPSRVSDPLAATPQGRHIDRALRNFGIESGKRVGQRLTFYFAGYSAAGANDDIGMIMASGSSDNMSDSLSLQYYRQFFVDFAPFNEVVFILDTHPLPIPEYPINFRRPAFTLSTKRESTTEVAMLSICSQLPRDLRKESEGSLTRAVMEGLAGDAASGDGKVTSTLLGNYVGDRVAELSVQQNIQNPSLVKVDKLGEIIFGEGPVDQLTGTLIVELPHWTAVLRVLDSQFREVPGIGPVEEYPPDSGKYQVQVDLPGGIYQVEAALDNEVESQFILIHTGKSAKIKRNSWRTLVFESAAPLAGITTNRKTQMGQAEQKSLDPTWFITPSGDSRLFLFLRTEYPSKYPSFYKGLKLLDQNGELVTDFSHGTKRNSQGGWMAFNANLPAGYYILRRGRSGVWLRQQPIYLCAGWETHVFLQSENNFPSLSTMALDMSPLGTGFHADDTTMAAAESVLASLGRSSRGQGITSSKRLQTLLDQNRDNPWLGILVSYTLLRFETEQGSESASMLQNNLTYLNDTIGGHPDVRALLLNREQPAGTPFWNPPLLTAGLSRVQAHAVHFSDTIRLDSLCDVVLDNFILNTPWTAWRHLDRSPLLKDGRLAAGFDTVSQKGAEIQAPTVTQPFSKAASPDLPVYHYSQAADADVDDMPDRPADSTPLQAAGTIRQAALQQQVQSMVAATDFESRPTSFYVNVSGDENSLLDNVNPQDVSEASGIPLARAQRGLAGLNKRQDKASEASQDEMAAEEALSADEQIVRSYAIEQQAAAYQKSVDYALDEQEESTLFGEGDPAVPTGEVGDILTAPKVTIEEISTNLMAEANRLHTSREKSDESETSQMLAKRLQALAASLLQRADYVVVTDLDCHIIKSNGAFLSLISPEGQPLQESGNTLESFTSKAEQQRKENRRLWEEAIRTTQANDNTMADPLLGEAGPQWVFKLTAVNDENGIQIANLYTFRQKDAPHLARSVLNDIADIIPDLTFNSSMFAYSSGDDANKYLKKLEKLIFEMEAIVI